RPARWTRKENSSGGRPAESRLVGQPQEAFEGEPAVPDLPEEARLHGGDPRLEDVRLVARVPQVPGEELLLAAHPLEAGGGCHEVELGRPQEGPGDGGGVEGRLPAGAVHDLDDEDPGRA